MTCEACSATVPSYDTVNCGNLELGCRRLCNQCFNAFVAQQSGLNDFDNSRIEPILLIDCDGHTHRFHFTTHLLGDQLAIEAFALKDGERSGHAFQVIGTPDEERFTLLGQLVQKMRRALARKHLIDDPGFGLRIADHCVRGTIDGDLSSPERMPVLVIDGQEIRWEDFGQMLMMFEGWQFRLEIMDRSEEA